jgi:hypothetical protein
MARRSKRDWPEWPEELKKPIVSADVVRDAEEISRRMGLLFDVFGIHRTGRPALDWHSLALALAVEFVPGLRIANSGAPRRWDDAAQGALLAHVDWLKTEKPERSTADVLRLLTQKGGPLEGQKSLRRRYDEARANSVARQIAAQLLSGEGVSDQFVVVSTRHECTIPPAFSGTRK